MMDALLYVINVHECSVKMLIGHDGYERGFHSQELIDVAKQFNYIVTEIIRNPRGATFTGEIIEIEFPQGNDVRFIEYLKEANGVLMGFKNGIPHAMAWWKQQMWDPANQLTFPLIRNDKLLETIFIPHIFLKVIPSD